MCQPATATVPTLSRFAAPLLGRGVDRFIAAYGRACKTWGGSHGDQLDHFDVVPASRVNLIGIVPVGANHAFGALARRISALKELCRGSGATPARTDQQYRSGNSEASTGDLTKSACPTFARSPLRRAEPLPD